MYDLVALNTFTMPRNYHNCFHKYFITTNRNATAHSVGMGHDQGSAWACVREPEAALKGRLTVPKAVMTGIRGQAVRGRVG